MSRQYSNLRQFSFGGTAAIVTGMGVIVGLNAATAAKAAVIGSLLIIGVADNLTDSLSVHIYQESERLEERQAFQTTLANFGVRFLLSMSFVLILLILPLSAAITVSLVWGFALLSMLSFLLARVRQVSALSEICKHAAVAIAVIAISRVIGNAIPFVIQYF